MPAFRSSTRRLALCLAIPLALGACSSGGGGEFNDPYEPQNRRVHAFNKGVDQILVRPSSNTYGAIVPTPVRKGVSNFSSNLNLPGEVVNHLLQGRIEPAVGNTFRFILNTTLGIGGLFDPATSIGVADDNTDFGETLHVWGVRQGAYLELPLLGPSSQRDMAGKVVDTAMNPINFVLQKPESNYATAGRIAARFGDRYQYSEFVDSVLYESADSYAQARLMYLQNRAFQLGTETETDSYDPYEDPYEQ